MFRNLLCLKIIIKTERNLRLYFNNKNMKNRILKWINLVFLEIKLIFNKEERTSTNIIKLIINKELYKFGIDYDYVVKHQEIDGKRWFEYYTFDNPKEYLSWERYSLRVIRWYYTSTKEQAKKEFSMLSLNYSLMFNFDYKLLDKHIKK